MSEVRLINSVTFRKAMYHEAMEKDSDEQKWESGCWIRYKMFERVLDEQPTIDPVKHGRWMYKHKDEDTGIENSYFCSECGCPKAHIYERFCAICGARMDGEVG